MRTTSAHIDTFTRDNLPTMDRWPELRFDLPQLHYPPVLNCAQALLDRATGSHGNRRCLVTDEFTWTYRDLLERVNQVAHVLVEDLGVVPGNRVLLRGPNTGWLVACWLAVLKAGGVAVTTMPLLRRSELRTIIEVSQPRLALCDSRYHDELDAVEAPGMVRIDYGGADDRDLLVLTASKPTCFEAVRTAADDVCLLAFTSGTTGNPKATMHVHRDVLAIADTCAHHVVRPTADDLFTGSPPLGFTFGLGALVIFPLRIGAASLLLEQTRPDQLLEAVCRHRASVLFTAPTAYRAMIPHLGDAELPELRTCVSAGERLPSSTWEQFHAATGLRIIDGIGSTELLHIFIAAPMEQVCAGSTGFPVPGYIAQVQDEGGALVPNGEAGLLAVKGPTGCRYLRGDRQETYVRNGWNVTGDIYVRDGDGYFWYQSRADDMIISAGYNIAAPEVEEVLVRHPAVAEAAVVGVPNSDRGVVVKAFVVASSGTLPTLNTARALQEFVKAEIAPYKYPRLVEFVESLPRTSTGKVQRSVLRAR